MSKLSKLREAIEHLEAAETILLDARRAFKEFTLEYDKLTYQADRASKAAEVTKTVLVHVEAGIYQAAQHRVQPTGGDARRIWEDTPGSDNPDVVVFKPPTSG